TGRDNGFRMVRRSFATARPVQNLKASSMGPRFQDRFEAGRLLAKRLRHYANDPAVVVLGLPRGGVPVAYEIARALNAPLDVFVVRKVGLPGYEELAMGAIASGGVRVWNEELVQRLAIPQDVLESAAEQEQQEL